MAWLWYSLLVVGILVILLAIAAVWFYWFLRLRFLDTLVRIFQEKPLFIIPRGQPIPDAEEVNIKSRDGLNLRGIYLKTTAARRRGVILFGLEYGSNRWSCVPYCNSLRQNGYDIFTFEVRGQGESDPQPGYEPLQWVTDFEVHDFQDALAYLKTRSDADPQGVGLFGISKGGSAGLIAASRDPYVRCFATDGVFATRTTMVPYMRKWVQIYSKRFLIQKWLPHWVYAFIAHTGLKKTQKLRRCRFPHLEHAMRKLAPRPLFMIHGEEDNYIKPEMARELFNLAGEPKDFWLVPKARHNQALHLVGEEYQQRLLTFFDRHLARVETQAPAPRTDQPDLLFCRSHLASSTQAAKV